MQRRSWTGRGGGTVREQEMYVEESKEMKGGKRERDYLNIVNITILAPILMFKVKFLFLCGNQSAESNDI